MDEPQHVLSQSIIVVSVVRFCKPGEKSNNLTGRKYRIMLPDDDFIETSNVMLEENFLIKYDKKITPGFQDMYFKMKV